MRTVSGNSRATCTKAYTSESVAAHSAAMRRPHHRGGAPTERVARGRRVIRRPRHISQRTLHDLQSCNVLNEMRQRPTLPGRSQPSTISAWRLNFCVRYGYRWNPPAIVTGNSSFASSPPLPLRSRSPRALARTPLSLRFQFLSPLSPHLQNRTDKELTSSLSLILSLASASASLGLRFRSSLSDQALDRLVSPSSTPHSASTDDLSTSSSLRGLTCFKQWQSSSSGGLHA